MVRMIKIVIWKERGCCQELVDLEPDRSLESKASTETSDGESSGSPYMSTSALSRFATLQIKSTCSGVHDDDHT